MNKKTLDAAHRHFKKTDKVMLNMIDRCGSLSLNGLKPPHFHALVSAIINQQLSVKAGRTIESRLLKKQGGRYFRADNILEITTAAIRECGLSKNKVRYICTLAQAICDGELNFRKIARMDDDAVCQQLIQYPGIGQWSVDMFLMFSLQRMDIFPVGDLVIRRSIRQHYAVAEQAKYPEYVAIAETWRPYRSIASFYLWKMAD